MKTGSDKFMDKKEFKKLTTKVYEEYGFVKKGKLYYLDLPDVLICSGFNTINTVLFLAFTFRIVLQLLPYRQPADGWKEDLQIEVSS